MNPIIQGLSLDDDPRRSFIRVIERMTHARRSWEIFRDFCEMLAITYANVAPHALWDKRETRYLQIAETYEREQLQAMAFMNACIVKEMERKGFDDVLGSIFMEMDLGSHWHGQFFTPYELCALIGRMTLDETTAREMDVIRWHEPACGAGAMMIAVAESLHAIDINPQRMLHTEAIDIDPLCVHMSVIQLSVLGLPAVVHLGDTLSGERWDRWCTPAHVLGFWDWRLRRADARIMTLSDGRDAAAAIARGCNNAESMSAPAMQSNIQPELQSVSQAQRKTVQKIDTTGNELEQMALF